MNYGYPVSAGGGGARAGRMHGSSEEEMPFMEDTPMGTKAESGIEDQYMTAIHMADHSIRMAFVRKVRGTGKCFSWHFPDHAVLLFDRCMAFYQRNCW